ncbi:hypothetical protein MSAN_00656400 [Mycena sanguinolenta]|uniref:Uncharacterized protein n=1 Tax=Mycena sanguinolenta TaxID=230812 RepID=A0A8H6Z122_9AGAR|nr:hypothetical protein MSAN_00656400 [Mycena sanguinolenta]
MRVPQELVYLIVDNLHDDIPSLKSCSLTARAFVDSAQTWLFNKVEILPPKIVLVGSETCFARDEYDEYLEQPHVPWVMSGETLSLVLALLDLKRISLIENSPSQWNEFGNFSMDWNQLGRSLKSALATVFSSPKLESCQFSRVNYFTQEWGERTSWQESKPWHPQLQSLLVSEIGSDPICRYLLHPRIDLTHITSLTIVTGSVEWKEKMARAAIGATHLALYQPHSPGTALKSILTPTLRSIHFFSTHLSASIPTTFEACPQNSCLERIVFEGPAGKFRTPLHSPSIDARIQAVMEHLGPLESVEIRAYVWTDAYNRYPFREWADNVRAMLPSLVGRGLLILTPITRAYEDLHHGWE